MSQELKEATVGTVGPVGDEIAGQALGVRGLPLVLRISELRSH